MANTDIIIVDGITMTMKEFKAKFSKKDNKQSKKRKKKVLSEKKIISAELKDMVKKIKLLKSLSAYYNNAYRQWGTIVKAILEIKEIKRPFVFYNMKVRDIEENLSEIINLAKHNENAIFHKIERLSYNLDDIKNYINELSTNIIKSGVIERYNNHECICGQDKRLGLQTIIRRTWGATQDLEKIISKCKTIISER